MFLNSVSVGQSLAHFRWVLSSGLTRLHLTLQPGCVLPCRLDQGRVPAKRLQVGVWIHFLGTAWQEPSSLLALCWPEAVPQVLAPSSHLQAGCSRGPLRAQPIHRNSPHFLVIHVYISSLLFFSVFPLQSTQ